MTQLQRIREVATKALLEINAIAEENVTEAETDESQEWSPESVPDEPDSLGQFFRDLLGEAGIDVTDDDGGGALDVE